MRTSTTKILALVMATMICGCQRKVSTLLCPAVPLSPEVKSFIDSAMANPAAANQVALLQRQVAELESKVNELQKANNWLQTMRDLRERNCAAAEVTIQSFAEKLQAVRAKEVTRLRTDLLRSCIDAGANRGRSGGGKRR